MFQRYLDAPVKTSSGSFESAAWLKGQYVLPGVGDHMGWTKATFVSGLLV